MHEAIIIGGGPAGLAAALTLGRVHRSVLLLDAGQGRNAPAEAVHNFLGHDGTPPAELRRIGREQLAPYPSVQVRDASVTGLEPIGSEAADGVGFRLTLADGEPVHGRRLLLATGLADELPPIDGLADLWGRSAFHCPYCHGYEVSGKPIAVIGSEPHKARLAVHLSRFTAPSASTGQRASAADVVLCANGPAELPDALRNALTAHGVAVREERIARLDGADGRLKRIVFDNGETLDRDAVFVATTLRQRSPIAEQLGCAIFPDGLVEVDEFGRTSVPGVLAAGDMARRATVPGSMAAVSVAAASGTIAGSIIDQELLTVDADLPDPFAPANA